MVSRTSAMPLMPEPPMPTKWSFISLLNMRVSGSGGGPGLEPRRLLDQIRDLDGGLGLAQAARRRGHARQVAVHEPAQRPQQAFGAQVVRVQQHGRAVAGEGG